MANKIKNTVAYYPFFVADGRTLYVLKKKYGLSGIGFFTELFRMLARTPGHIYSMREEFDRQRLYDFIGESAATVFDFLDTMAETGKIDRPLWEEKRVIVSADFMESLAEANMVEH